MFNEIKHLQKISAKWFNTSEIDKRTTMILLKDGVLYIAQRENPSDIWPPMVKMQLDGIGFEKK
jgi:hypothetical protein